MYAIRSYYEFLTDAGELYAVMQADIDAAQESICLEFYILDPAGRVGDVLAAVERAAQRGVDCKILADDFGSRITSYNVCYTKLLRK